MANLLKSSLQDLFRTASKLKEQLSVENDMSHMLIVHTALLLEISLAMWDHLNIYFKTICFSLSNMFSCLEFRHSEMERIQRIHHYFIRFLFLEI